MPETQPVNRSEQINTFIQGWGAQLRAGDKPPASQTDWESQRQLVRKKLIAAFGGFPEEKCPLEPQILGELERDGYKVQKVIFQTRPGVFMTANAYVPAKDGKLPAVLCVHGHWKGAKQDPVVQSRCIGLAKLGFFVLAVDAFGAGERGTTKNLGQYHGEMIGATLLPVGVPLAGFQVYENMRAVDYLQSRPEVDGTKLGITGASGGGNQSMYAGSLDDRLTAVVPVCSVGTYLAYLQSACCMCEVTPGGVSLCEESGILGLVAPRALMIVNATMDSFNFSVGESSKTVARLKTIYELYGKPDHLKHAIFESKHDYNQPMREAMYGWMTKHLKGEGDGSPIPEPTIETEDPETLRCYPGETRPDDFVTIPKFAKATGQALVDRLKPPDHREAWDAARLAMRYTLERDVLGGFPKKSDPKAEMEEKPGDTRGRRLALLTFEPEPGIVLTAKCEIVPESKTLAILIDTEKGLDVADDPMAEELRKAGRSIVSLELRGTGKNAPAADAVMRAIDHNSAERAIWIGRPLIGQWTWDVLRLMDVIEQKLTGGKQAIQIVGIGPAGVVALCAAALDQRVRFVCGNGLLGSYLTDAPYEKQRLGVLAPHVVKKVGDIPQLAALVAPRKMMLSALVRGSGGLLSEPELSDSFLYTSKIYELLKSAGRFAVTAELNPANLVRQMTKT